MGDGRGVDDRGRRLPIGEEAVEHSGKVVDRLEVEPDVEAVLAGDAVAFGNLWNLLRQRRDALELARRRFDSNDGRQLIPSARGSMTARNPVMMPTSTSRWTRSEVAGGDRFTRRPSSAIERRPSATSSPMIFRSIWSRRTLSKAIDPELPFFIR